MPSTYSPSLRLELIGPGEQAGTWNTTTNTNLGTLLDSAIAGYTTVSVTSAAQAFTALDGAADQARNAVIELTTTTGAAFAVYAPPQEKTYIIFNNSAHTATIYNSTVLGNTTAAGNTPPTGTPLTIPAGEKRLVFSDGTDFYTLTLPTGTVTSVGGTGTVNGITLTGTVTSSGNLTLGGTLSNVSLTSQVTGTLPVANGGTGTVTPSLVNGSGIAVTGTWPNQTITATGGGGTVSQVDGTGTVNGLTLTGSVTTTGSLTLGGSLSGTASGLSIGGNAATATFATSAGSATTAGSLSGILGTGSGGTGSSSLAGAGIPTLSASNSFSGSNGFRVSPNGNVAVFAQAPNSSGAGVVSQNTGSGVPLAVATDQGNLGVLDVFYAGVFPGVTTLGYHQQSGSGVVLTSISDYRLKENVAPLSNAVTKLKQLAPKNYTWVNYPETGVTDGFIAHELQAVIPHAVSGEKDAIDQDGKPKYQAVSYSSLVPLLTAALQEAVARIEALEARVGA